MPPNVSSSDSGIMKRRGSFLFCRCQPLWCRGRDSMERSLIAMAKKGFSNRNNSKPGKNRVLRLSINHQLKILFSHTKFILTRFDPQKFFVLLISLQWHCFSSIFFHRDLHLDLVNMPCKNNCDPINTEWDIKDWKMLLLLTQLAHCGLRHKVSEIDILITTITGKPILRLQKLRVASEFRTKRTKCRQLSTCHSHRCFLPIN